MKAALGLKGDALSRADRMSLAGMSATVVALHVVGFGVLFGLVAPQQFALGGDHSVFTVGVGLLAYTLGLARAFDIDHVCAIDCTTRQLMTDHTKHGPRPLSVGFWFSLGHSTVVLTFAVLLTLGMKSLAGPVLEDNSTLHAVTGTIGASVSGAFLWMVGLMNLAALVGITRAYSRMRAGARLDEGELNELLRKRGLLTRWLGALTARIREPRHIYPVGVAFGLGFDSATQIGLLVLAGGGAVFNLPFYAILVLPVLFTAGMCLFDTLDGVFMNAAYGWAQVRGERKVIYNLTVTGVSVAVSLAIGTVQLVSVIVDRAHITQGPLAAISGINVEHAGYAVAALFGILLLAAATATAFGKLQEQRIDQPTREAKSSTAISCFTMDRAARGPAP